MADQQPEGCQQERGNRHRHAVTHEATRSQPVASLGQQTDSDKVGRGAQESGIARGGGVSIQKSLSCVFHCSANDHHRRLSVSQDAVAHTAQQQARQCAMTPTTHHDEVTLPNVGYPQDGVGRRAFKDFDDDFQASLL